MTDVGIIFLCLTNVFLVSVLSLIAYKAIFSGGTVSANLRSAANDLGSIKLDTLESALGSSVGLVSEMDALKGDEFPKWKSDHRAEINQLLASRNQLDIDLAQTKEKLSRAHALVTKLHKQNKALSGESGKLESIRKSQRDIAAELEDARGKLALAKRDMANQVAAFEDERESHALLQKHLREESERLMRLLDIERSTLDRTLIEKNFIESIYVETDAAVDELDTLKRKFSALSEEHHELRQNRDDLLELLRDFQRKSA
jgi:chromosome segregation ATPase